MWRGTGRGESCLETGHPEARGSQKGHKHLWGPTLCVGPTCLQDDEHPCPHPLNSSHRVTKMTAEPRCLQHVQPLSRRPVGGRHSEEGRDGRQPPSTSWGALTLSRADPNPPHQCILQRAWLLSARLLASAAEPLEIDDGVVRKRSALSALLG